MENAELEVRIAKLEKQGAARFFVQYLLSPLLVLAVGAIMNYRVESNKADIEKAKSDIQRIELAQKMIPILFAGNPDQAFATQRLMEKILEPAVATEFRDLIANYYKAKVESDIKKGDIKSAVETLNAARSIGGTSADQVVQSVAQNQSTNATIQQGQKNLQVAAQKEREGFENLIAGRYEDAAKSFQASEAAYNSYHNVNELARLLKTRGQEMNDENKRKEIFRLIVEKYSYGAPPDLLNQIKAMAK